MKVSYTEEDKIKNLLMGRTVTKVGDSKLLLDDGTVLVVQGNHGCGGCANGWFDITELNECPVNAIMNVEFTNDADDEYEVFRIFVYAENERIKLLEVDGSDNGYYGVGYWIEVST